MIDIAACKLMLMVSLTASGPGLRVSGRKSTTSCFPSRSPKLSWAISGHSLEVADLAGQASWDAIRELYHQLARDSRWSVSRSAFCYTHNDTGPLSVLDPLQVRLLA